MSTNKSNIGSCTSNWDIFCFGIGVSHWDCISCFGNGFSCGNSIFSGGNCFGVISWLSNSCGGWYFKSGIAVFVNSGNSIISSGSSVIMSKTLSFDCGVSVNLFNNFTTFSTNISVVMMSSWNSILVGGGSF
jgi:hypothetical protein